MARFKANASIVNMKNRKFNYFGANIIKNIQVAIYYHGFILQIKQFASKYSNMLDEETKKKFILKFANQLGKIKKEKNLSFRKIADNCDLDASFISKIEKGTENITLETILNLMYGLNVKPKELFDFDFDLKQDDIRN